MARCWIFLLVGIALIQGIFTLSPTPVPEDEWEEFSRMMRSPAYRLPTTTRPRHYEVSLTPYFDNPPNGTDPFTFDGEVTVYISPTENNVNEIIMHCDDLTILSLSVEYLGPNGPVVITNPVNTYQCEMPYAFLRIPVTQTLQLDTEYIVRSTFKGNFQSNMRGFYASWYYDSSNTKRWMGTTQFQPGHARQAFPCYDEPVFKATFDITMNREESFSPTISNMPIKNKIELDNGRVAEIFHTTPKTSTYLLAFIVSHYEPVAVNGDPVRPFEIYARDNVGITGNLALDIGELLLEEMEEYTQIPYYTMADHMNMKQAAIPDFSAGAMENWGILTYREANILYDPLNSNHFYKQRVPNIVAHEIAHMWFGNLVTCAWWDVLWLNEGFARFYQYFLTSRVAPDLGFEIRFIPEQVHTSLLSDSVDTAHALINYNVNDPTSVSSHFSTITYAKGASIIRMTQYMLGEDTFIKALRIYLANRKYDVAEPQHLYAALDQAAAEDGAISAYNGITMQEYFSTWANQGGHPLLTVIIDQRTGQMTITQARWERDTGVSKIPSLWYIPVTWTRGGAPDFENLKPSTVLTEQVNVLQRGTTGLEWVIFNKQQTGFYRVNYDDTNWALITLALRGNNRTVIHQLSRAQIVDDVFNFARSGLMSYDKAFNILSFLEFEDEYAPWLAAITGFNYAFRRLAHDDDALQKLKDLIIKFSAAVTARLGFSEIPGESYMDGLQRMYVHQFLCNVGHEQCISAGIQNFQSWKNGGFIPANMRPWVYCTGLRNGNAEDFDYFWNRYLAEDLSNEKVVMLETAGCTSNEASLQKFLNAIVAGDEDIRAQDYTTALSSAVTGNEFNGQRVFNWLKNNVAQTAATLGSVATPLNYISTRLLSEQQILEFESWLEANQEIIGSSSYNTGKAGAASARSNLLWSNKRMAEFQTFFEYGYIAPELEDISEGEEETPELEETEEEEIIDGGNETDSASIAKFSVITIVITLTINLFA